MFSAIWINFWDISWTYLFFFNIRNIRRNCQITFLKCFPIIYFWWIIYSIPTIFIDKWFNIWNSFWIPLNFFIISKTYWKHLWSVFLGFIVVFFFFIQSVESIYESPRLKFTLWHFQCINWTESKIKSLLLIDVSKFPWYLERSDSKSSSTT